MFDRLVLSTKKSLYKPIEIEIDGMVYHNRKVTRELLAELDKIEKQITKENNDAMYKWINTILEIKLEILEQLDKREVEDIYLHVRNKFFEIEKERMELTTKMFEETAGLKKQPKKTIPKNRKKSEGAEKA